MKFYIAARFEFKEQVLALYKQVKAAGHQISFDWTQHASIKPYDQNPELAAQYAQEDFNGVKNCDVFVLLSSEARSAGMFVEFGCALMSNDLTGLPHIFVVGDEEIRSVFFMHPSVRQVGTIDEVLKIVSE